MKKLRAFCYILATITTIVFASGIGLANDKGDIIHDAEHYILEAQHGEKNGLLKTRKLITS